MSSWKKTRERVMSGEQDANIGYDELCTLLWRLGYVSSQKRGSHRVFRKAGLPYINLQESTSGKAKSYQVAQVRQQLSQNQL